MEGMWERVVALRSDKLISNEMRLFCMTAGETHSDAIEKQEGHVMADKETIILSKDGVQSQREGTESVTDISTKTCVQNLPGSIKADRKAKSMCLA